MATAAASAKPKATTRRSEAASAEGALDCLAAATPTGAAKSTSLAVLTAATRKSHAGGSAGPPCLTRCAVTRFFSAAATIARWSSAWLSRLLGTSVSLLGLALPSAVLAILAFALLLAAARA